MKRDGARFVDYEELTRNAAVELERGARRQVGLQLVCDLLRRKVDYYDWVGFYLASWEDQLLVLGPFSGRPVNGGHIPYGRGVCGRVAQSGTILRVNDTWKDDTWKDDTWTGGKPVDDPMEEVDPARNPAIRSRIVAPVFLASGTKADTKAGAGEGVPPGAFIAEIVIDSNRPAAFSREDEEFLQALATMVAPFVPRIPTGDA
jgi:L-methionine (R)-S-oxide reductase